MKRDRYGTPYPSCAAFDNFDVFTSFDQEAWSAEAADITDKEEEE